MSIAHLTSPAFKENAREALADPQLQSALHGIETGIVDRRRAVVANLPEFDALRDSARDIKNHTLAHLDLYLERFEQRCTAKRSRSMISSRRTASRRSRPIWANIWCRSATSCPRTSSCRQCI